MSRTALVLDVTPGDPTTVWVADADRTPANVVVTPAAALTTEQQDGLVAIQFTPGAAQVDLTVVFE